ncbi:MAG: hypothetical protein Q4F53_07505 [Nesterenkonia sp.]|nr:hypothetical protein [Nesterenkonia sp.]
MPPSRSRQSGDGDARSRAKEAVERTPQEAKDLKDTALGRGGEDKLTEVQERWETRLAWPVLIAALLSVPAVFLTLLDEPWEAIGHVVLYAVSAVLVFEATILFLVSPEKIAWLRRNWWLVGLTIGSILAVIFSIGPLQLFRMLRSVGALRVLRAKQIARAGESLGKAGTWWRALLGKVLATVVVGVFVVIALIDPDSPARSTLENLVGEDGAILASIVVGLIAMGGMYLLVRDPRGKDEDEQDEDADDSDQSDRHSDED